MKKLARYLVFTTCFSSKTTYNTNHSLGTNQ